MKTPVLPLVRLTAVRLTAVLVLGGLANVALGTDSGGPAAENSPGDRDARIAQLIEKLGDDQYTVREGAQRQLQDLGLAAFDALLEARHHEDIEIALRAGYLVRSLPIQWTDESDPPAVQNLLRNYGEASRVERRNRMQQLAALDDSQGAAALCRLMRFESDSLRSKQAALLVMSHAEPRAPAQRADLAETIRKRVGPSKRPAAIWLRTYARTLVAPEETLSDWDQIAQDELATLAQFPERTDRTIVRDLLRWQVGLLDRLQHEQQSLAVTRRMIELMEGDREELFDFVDWLLEHESWAVVDEVAARFPSEFHKHAILVYCLAEARRARGATDLAEQTAEKALKMDPETPERHNLLARHLTRRQLYDWAEREFRQVLETTDADHRFHLEARFLLSDLLFDLDRKLEAAEVLDGVVKQIDANPRVLQQVPLRSAAQVRGAMHYYYAMHFADQGEDPDKQMEHLRQAVKHDPSNPDIIIGMYQVEEPDEQWEAEAAKYLKVSKERLRERISRYQQILDDPRTREERPTMADQLANTYNELAWLISNTEGDFQAARRYSEKSLELRPDHAAYLDTLGRCCFALGDLENAVKYQARAAERAPYLQQIRRQLKLFEEQLAKQRSQDAPSNR